MEQDEIISTINDLKLDVALYSLEKSEMTVSNILKTYSKKEIYEYPLWDNIAEKASYYNPDGWKFIADFRRNSKKLLFTEPSKGIIVFEFNNSIDLVNMLDNSYGFVFYVTDINISYLLCFNDHDYLIGCGDAKYWVGSLGS